MQKGVNWKTQTAAIVPALDSELGRAMFLKKVPKVLNGHMNDFIKAQIREIEEDYGKFDDADEKVRVIGKRWPLPALQIQPKIGGSEFLGPRVGAGRQESRPGGRRPEPPRLPQGGCCRKRAPDNPRWRILGLQAGGGGLG